MNRVGAAVLFLSAVFVGQVFLPAATTQAEAPAPPDTPTFQSGVNLVQVPVVVRDRDGHAVKGLHKEDFQLFDRGKLQEIASFVETKPGGQIAPDRSQTGVGRAAGAGMVVPERFVAFLFDDVAIRNSADLTRIRDAATRRLAALDPSDRAAVLTTSCRVLLDFTDDQAKIQEAVSRIAFQAVPVCRVAQTEVLQLAVLNSVVRRMALLPGERSVILISPGFSVGHDRTAEEAELIDTAIRSRVLIDALDVGGVAGAPPISASAGPVRGMAGQTNGQVNNRRPSAPSNRQPGASSTNPVALRELAHGTGGTYVAAGNDLDVGFRKLATPESFYVLGFSPGESKADGSFHELKVKLKEARKLTVQARGGYFAPARKQE
jgi:VWFA-related protein